RKVRVQVDVVLGEQHMGGVGVVVEDTLEKKIAGAAVRFVAERPGGVLLVHHRVHAELPPLGQGRLKGGGASGHGGDRHDHSIGPRPGHAASHRGVASGVGVVGGSQRVHRSQPYRT